MEYNTQRENLQMTEYGRHIKQMIEFIKTMPDKETRTKAANAVVQAMMTVQQGHKEMTDIKRKLWDNLILISDFQLDVDSPYPLPERDKKVSAKFLNYSVPYEVRFRFYGRYVEKMIKKAVEMEEGEDKNELVRAIANTMKKLYLTWNKDSVKDEVIIEQLNILSDGKLKLEEGCVLQDTTDFMKNNKMQQKQWGQSGKKNKKNKYRKK
jgi:molybdopterin converting factor small subunit